MKNVEDFDDLIRRKAELANHEFNEAHWEKAQQLLDARQIGATANSGARKTLSFLPLLIVGVFGVSAATGVYINSFFENTNLNVQTNNIEIITNSKNQNVNEKIITSEKLLADNNLASNSTKSDLENKSLANYSSKNTSEATINNSARLSPSQNASSMTRNTNASEVNNSAINAKLASKKSTESSTPNSVLSDSKTSNNSVVNTNASNTKVIVAASKNKKVNNQPKTEIQGVSPNSISSNSENAVNTNVSEALLNSESFEFVSLMPRSANLATDSEERGLIPQQFSTPKKDGDYHESNKRKSNFLNVEAGTTYNTGWRVDKKQDANGFNWYAGLNYGFYTGKKTSVSFGLQTYNFSNIKNAFYKTSSTEYGFGSTITYTDIATNNLQYIAVPIEFNFQPSRLHIFSFGVNASTAVYAKNSLTTYNISDDVKSNSVVQNNTGIYDAVNSKNIMLTAAYKFNVSGRWWINLEANYGLSDVFNSKSMLSGKQTTSGGRLGLTYTIFDK